MHKMPDLLFLETEMLTLRMATLTLLNISRHVSAIASCRLLAKFVKDFYPSGLSSSEKCRRRQMKYIVSQSHKRSFSLNLKR